MFGAIGRRAFVFAGAILATGALALAHAAGAQQTPAPGPRASATPVPTPVAFSGHAHANVTVVTQNATFDGALQLGIAQRTNLTRIDVLGVKSSTLPIPPIGVTAVIDRGSNTLTIWNDTTKKYRVQPFIPRSTASPTPRASASSRPSASPRPSSSPRQRRSPFADLDVASLTIKMTGHTTTAGLPTTGLSLDLQVQRKGDKSPSHVTATAQLADEFLAFPVTLDVSLEPGAVPFSAKLSYAVDDLTRDMPPLARFKVPAGYTEAKSIPEVIFQGRRPTTLPTPVPSPR